MKWRFGLKGIDGELNLFYVINQCALFSQGCECEHNDTKLNKP
jgi:hypothetical protein